MSKMVRNVISAPSISRVKESAGHASIDVDEDFDDLIPERVLESHLVHGLKEDFAFMPPITMDGLNDVLPKTPDPLSIPCLPNDYKDNASAPSLDSVIPSNPNSVIEVDSDRRNLQNPHISKAAARMRKYRHDHRNDADWLKKESIRRRAMRAKRKREAVGADRTGHAECEVKLKVETNLMDYNRKEAERARKYRAIKRLDPVWKERDAARMRVWRAKRKADTGLKIEKSTQKSLTPTNIYTSPPLCSGSLNDFTNM